MAADSGYWRGELDGEALEKLGGAVLGRGWGTAEDLLTRGGSLLSLTLQWILRQTCYCSHHQEGLSESGVITVLSSGDCLPADHHHGAAEGAVQAGDRLGHAIGRWAEGHLGWSLLDTCEYWRDQFQERDQANGCCWAVYADLLLGLCRSSLWDSNLCQVGVEWWNFLGVLGSC